ncbi:MAG: class I tRNA ligase family protein, partial [Parcubacteria group bacterium]
NYELDLHKPYIDEVVLEKDGKEYKRTPEVMDVWLDSGAMPFAVESPYPADFISEGIDQTRGWFYTLHAVGSIMGKGRAYKNVICLGHILDEEGKKMSKSVGNVLDPWEMIDKYGVDVLRLWMYSVNQPGESKSFDERTVEEVGKKIFNMLDNVYNFYDVYTPDKNVYAGRPSVENPMDTWMLARTDKLVSSVTHSLEEYKLLEPVRAMREYVDDLSTWYLRRSRQRLREGDREAQETLLFSLKTLAKVMAPFAPFASEDLYMKLRNDKEPESVHLCSWPAEERSVFSLFTLFGPKRGRVFEDMEKVRSLVTLALDERQKAGIRVRQPLAKLEVRDWDLGEEYAQIIKDEVNVKELVVNKGLDAEVQLDTELTPELEEEGRVREVIRKIQDMRKEKNLEPGDIMKYEVEEEDKEIFAKYSSEIKEATSIEI